jgi:hypothetical protein
MTGSEYNVWSDDDTLDHWTDSLEEAVTYLTAHVHDIRKGAHAHVTEYPARNQNGELDPTTRQRIITWRTYE